MSLKAIDRRATPRAEADRRATPRFYCTLPVILHAHGETPFNEVCKLIDVCHHGTRVRSRNQIAPLVECDLIFYRINEDLSGYHGYSEILATSLRSTEKDREGYCEVGFFFIGKPSEIHGIPQLIEQFSQ